MFEFQGFPKAKTFEDRAIRRAARQLVLNFRPQTLYRRQQKPPLKYGIGHKRRFSSLCLATLFGPEPTLMFSPRQFARIGGAHLFLSVSSFRFQVSGCCCEPE